MISPAGRNGEPYDLQRRQTEIKKRRKRKKREKRKRRSWRSGRKVLGKL
jgi:hypothetical protein